MIISMPSGSDAERADLLERLYLIELQMQRLRQKRSETLMKLDRETKAVSLQLSTSGGQTPGA